MALAPLRERLRHVPAPVADAGLAVAVALAVSVAIGVSTEAGSRVPDLLAHLLGLAIGVPVLFRRRWPLGMLTVSAAILLLYYSADYPGIPPAVPLGVTVYTAAAAGRLRGAVLVVVALYGTGIVFRLGEDERALALLSDTVREAALVGALFFLGDAVRSRRAYAEEVRERLHRAEAERDHEARRRVAEERLRIARELHDVIAHTVSVITVHAGVAADVLDDRPDLARSALGTIRTAGREALDELRTTVGVLRASGEPASDQPPTAPAPGLAQIENLLETARRTGLGVAVVVEGDRRPLPAAVDLAGYRIVQESLTNVIRHAGAAHATVSIRYRPGCVEVEIGDDGCGPAWSSPPRAARPPVGSPWWPISPRPGPPGRNARTSQGSDRKAGGHGRMTIRVLLADDQMLVRAGFRVLLDRDDDIEVVGEAADGAEAVALVRLERPDLVLMDIRMPVMDGLEATRRIVGDENLTAVKVVVLTTFELDEYVFEAVRAGAAGFLVKDIDPDDLRHAVRVVAGGDALLTPSVTRRLLAEFAVATTGGPSGPERLDPLTDREREVMVQVAGGLSNTEIARGLHVSPATAKTHVNRAMTKLGARDRAQLVVLAYETGLVIAGRH